MQYNCLNWRFLIGFFHLTAPAQRSANQWHLETPRPGLKTDDEAVSVVASERWRSLILHIRADQTHFKNTPAVNTC